MIVDCAAYRDGRRCGGRLSVEEARAFIGQPGTFVWIGLRMPTQEELDGVQACFAADGASPEDLDLEAAASPHQRPVLAIDPGLTSLWLRTAHYNDLLERVSLGELSVIVGRALVVTLRHGQASPLDGVRHALEADPDLLRHRAPGGPGRGGRAGRRGLRPALDGFERGRAGGRVRGLRRRRPPTRSSASTC